MTFRLADGGVVRLAAIGAPMPPPDRGEGRDARESREALEHVLHGHSLSLRGAIETDRYDRTVAQISRDDGEWVEAVMVSDGEAWVATTPEHREFAGALLRLEAEARDQRRGLWRNAYYAIKPVASFVHTDDRFAILEGELRTVTTRHGATTIDFAAGTLTLRLDAAARRRLTAADLDIDSLSGSRIRVRGFPYWAGHPVLDLSHPEQIEFLDHPPAAPQTGCGGH